MAVFLTNQCTFSKIPNSDQQQVISNGKSQISQNSNDSNSLNLNGTSNIVGANASAGLSLQQQSTICGAKFESLSELIQHIEDNHIYDIDYPNTVGPIYNGHQQHHLPHMTQIINGGWLPTSCILRIFNSSTKKSTKNLPHQLPVHHLMQKLQATQQQLQAQLLQQRQQIKYESATGIIMNHQGQDSHQTTNVIGPISATHMQLQIAPIGQPQMQPHLGLHPQQLIGPQQSHVQVQQIPIPQQQAQQQQVQTIQQMAVHQQIAPQPAIIHSTLQQMPLQPQQQPPPPPQGLTIMQQQLSVPQPQQLHPQQPTQGPQIQQITVQTIQQQPINQVQQIQEQPIQQQPTQPASDQIQQQQTPQQQVPPASTPTNIQKPAKEFKCTHCSKTYKTQRGLRTHKNTHHPEFTTKKE